MRICAAPNCTVDLDDTNVRSDADCCSGACRAAKSRAKRSPDAEAAERFWRGFDAITARVGSPSPARELARSQRAT